MKRAETLSQICIAKQANLSAGFVQVEEENLRDIKRS